MHEPEAGQPRDAKKLREQTFGEKLIPFRVTHGDEKV